MRKKCILHIGMHKTGTSSLQLALTHHLIDPRFHYTEIDQDTGDVNHNRAFSSIFKKNPYAYHGNLSIGMGVAEVNAYRIAAQKKIISSFLRYEDEITEIISGEDIGYFDRDEVLVLRDFLRLYFDHIIVVAYIRSATSYINSAVQELVKHGANTFEFGVCGPGYGRFKMFSDVFGMDSVIYKSYDLIVGEKLSVVSDFSNLFHINFELKSNNIEDNISLTLEAISVLYTYQKYSFRKRDRFYFQTQKSLIDALAQLGNTRLSLGSKLINQIIGNDNLGIEFLERYFNLNVLIPESTAVEQEFNIDDENSLIDYAVECYDKLKMLLATYGIFCPLAERSQTGIAELVRSLDSGINGNLLNSEFYI